MKVTFDIEIDDRLVQSLDYYENYGEVTSPDAGCKKCIFHPMCAHFTDKLGDILNWNNLDCKLPCWNSKRDRIAGTNRKVFVFNKQTKKL